jgi:chaperone modulatory protein CbpM
MDKPDPSTPPVEVIDEQTTFTLVELCRCCAVEAEHIEAMVEQGILVPVGRRGEHWYFPASSLRRTRITLHLQRDLGVNLAGAALAIELLERIDELDRGSKGS